MSIVALYVLQTAVFFAMIRYGLGAARGDETLTIDNALGRSKRLVATGGVAAVFFGLALAAELTDRFCQILPLVMQQYSTWIMWSAFSIVFAAIAGYTWSLAHARKNKQSGGILFAVLLINVATVVGSFRHLAPIADHLPPASTIGGVVLQTSGSTCAAASLANVANRLGQPLDEREAARRLATSRTGTTRGQIRSALRELELKYKSRTCQSLADVTPPAIIFIDHPAAGREGHAVAYMARVGDKYEIWDPIIGRVSWGESRSQEIWHGSAIECAAR